MNCNTCISANPINVCASSIIIPHVSGPPDENYQVTLTDTATGRVSFYSVLAVGHELTITLDDELMHGHTYKIMAYHNGVTDDPHTFDISGETGCCIEFKTMDFGDPSEETLSVGDCNSATDD